MHIACSHCGRTLEYTGEPPSFCAYCGRALAETRVLTPGPLDPEAATLAPSECACPAFDSDPSEIGGFRLLRTLGTGGMGKVYEAEEVVSGRHVALKLIGGQFAESADAVERFRQEGRLASLVAHPRCVFVLAADEQAGRPYIVMELMPGATLQDLVKEKGPLPPEKAVAMILDVLDGLQEAHRLGVIHRDVKPSNCFVDDDGRAKIGDFGLSKSLVVDTQLTRTGAFLGTPLYASPEQIRKEPVDQQTDVYSVAATLYFLLAGRAPFESTDAAVTLARIVADPAPSLRKLRPGLPRGLDRVVLRGLERDRHRRYRSLEEFRAALLRFAPGQLSASGLGLRFGAYMLDWVLLLTIPFLASFVVGLIGHGSDALTVTIQKTVTILSWGVEIAYFGILEGLWGASLGKRLLRLRVCGRRDGDPPGLARGLVRAAVFIFLVSMPGWPYLFYDADPAQQRNPVNILVGCSVYPLLALYLTLLFFTMRKRNGYRGSYEFLSGTRTIRLPEIERPLTVPSQPIAVAEGVNGWPPALQHFKVLGLIGKRGDERLLLGEDPSLGRRVLIWLRPATAPPVDEARPKNDRPTRLRWLSQGHDHLGRWDVFLAPSGLSLPELVARRGRLEWHHARQVLLQLTEELLAGLKDSDLPEQMSIDQLWIQPNGQLLLLEWPLRATAAEAITATQPIAGAVATPTSKRGTPSAPTLVVPPSSQGAWQLVCEAARITLEGLKHAPQVAWIRAPIPLYANELLQRAFVADDDPRTLLTGLAEQLRAVHDRPSRTTRVRRLAQQAIQAAFLAVGLWTIVICAFMQTLAPFVILQSQETAQQETRQILQERATAALAVAMLQPSTEQRLHGLAQYQADMELCGRLDQAVARSQRDRQARIADASPMARAYGLEIEKAMGAQSKQLKVEVRRQAARGSLTRLRGEAHSLASFQMEGRVINQFMFHFTAVMILFWPVTWTIWALIARGGFSYWLAGLVLVRANGKKAWRLQCFVRALLLWLPVVALLYLSLNLEYEFWAGWRSDQAASGLMTASIVSWFAAWLLLLGYWIAALVWPRRTPIDYLLGTYCVPR